MHSCLHCQTQPSSQAPGSSIFHWLLAQDPADRAQRSSQRSGATIDRSIEQCWVSLMALQDVCACARTIRVVVVVIFISLGFCQHVLPYDSSLEEEEEKSRNSSRPAVVRSPEYHHPTVRSVALKHVVARGDEQLKNSTSYDTGGNTEHTLLVILTFFLLKNL